MPRPSAFVDLPVAQASQLGALGGTLAVGDLVEVPHEGGLWAALVRSVTPRPLVAGGEVVDVEVLGEVLVGAWKTGGHWED